MGPVMNAPRNAILPIGRRVQTMSQSYPLATLLISMTKTFVLNMELGSAVNHFSVNALDKISDPAGFYLH